MPCINPSQSHTKCDNENQLYIDDIFSWWINSPIPQPDTNTTHLGDWTPEEKGPGLTMSKPQPPIPPPQPPKPAPQQQHFDFIKKPSRHGILSFPNQGNWCNYGTTIPAPPTTRRTFPFYQRNPETHPEETTDFRTDAEKFWKFKLRTTKPPPPPTKDELKAESYWTSQGTLDLAPWPPTKIQPEMWPVTQTATPENPRILTMYIKKFPRRPISRPIPRPTESPDSPLRCSLCKAVATHTLLNCPACQPKPTSTFRNPDLIKPFVPKQR